MKTVIVTSATGEPITLAEAKEHLRVNTTDNDDYITNLITVARQRVEEITNRKLMPQTWKVYYDAWPSSGDNYDHIDLPYPPLSTVPSTGIVYTNSDGDSTTFSSTAWASDTVSEPGRVVLEYDDDWPTETLHNRNPIAIEFQCGYSGSTAVPERIKQAIKIILAELYEQREISVVGQSVYTNSIVENLLSDYRVFTF
jgi:uncharacterized phiE125 gp8 family phage protein